MQGSSDGSVAAERFSRTATPTTRAVVFVLRELRGRGDPRGRTTTIEAAAPATTNHGRLLSRAAGGLQRAPSGRQTGARELWQRRRRGRGGVYVAARRRRIRDTAAVARRRRPSSHKMLSAPHRQPVSATPSSWFHQDEEATLVVCFGICTRTGCTLRLRATGKHASQTWRERTVSPNNGSPSTLARAPEPAAAAGVLRTKRTQYSIAQ